MVEDITAKILNTTSEYPQAGNNLDDLEKADGSNDEHWEDSSGHKCMPSLIPTCNSVISDLNIILSPQYCFGFGHNLFEEDNLQKWLEMMKIFLWNYYKPVLKPLTWIVASEQTAKAHQKGKLTAQNHCKWTCSLLNIVMTSQSIPMAPGTPVCLTRVSSQRRSMSISKTLGNTYRQRILSIF